MEKVWLKHYEMGVPYELTLPDKTLPELLQKSIEKYADSTAMVFMGNRIKYWQLGELTDRFCAAIQSLGMGKGSRLAIHLPNCPQFVVSFYGALKAGCTVIPCNPLYVERELEHQLKDSGAEMIVTLTRFYPVVRRLKEKTNIATILATNIKEYFPPHLKLLYTLAKEKKEGDRVKVEEGDLWLQKLLSQAEPDQAVYAEQDVEADACFLYTGGTTGVSKGAVLSHRNLVANVCQMKSWLTDLKEGKETTLSVLPFFHSYGMTAAMNFPVASGGKMVLVPRFDLQLVLKLINQEKPTLFPGVPTMYVAILNAPDLARYNLGHIRACLSGAAPLPVEVQEQFEKVTGGRLVEAYGLSETSPATHANPLYGKRKPGSIGVPLPSTLAKITDPEDPNRELATGESGELVVQGPQVMKGYLNMPEETAQVLREGWFYTGDIAQMDEDGFFYIVDRKKDMVIAGGYNIFPREIEEVLYTHEKIREAAVAGIPDLYKGEILKAYIVLKERQTMTEEEVLQHCRENLARYKVPSLVEFRAELPKSLIGKVLRRVLVEEERQKQAKGEQ